MEASVKEVAYIDWSALEGEESINMDSPKSLEGEESINIDSRKSLDGIWLSREVCSTKSLTPLGKMIFGYLLVSMGNNGRCWPNQPKIASYLGTSYRVVSKVIKKLTKKGYIVSQWGKRDGNKELFYLLGEEGKRYSYNKSGVEYKGINKKLKSTLSKVEDSSTKSRTEDIKNNIKETTTKDGEGEVDLIKEGLTKEDPLRDTLTFLCLAYQSILGGQFKPTAKDRQNLKAALSQFPADSIRATIAQTLRDVRDKVKGVNRFSLGLVRYRLNNPQNAKSDQYLSQIVSQFDERFIWYCVNEGKKIKGEHLETANLMLQEFKVCGKDRIDATNKLENYLLHQDIAEDKISVEEIRVIDEQEDKTEQKQEEVRIDREKAVEEALQKRQDKAKAKPPPSSNLKFFMGCNQASDCLECLFKDDCEEKWSQ